MADKNADPKDDKTSLDTKVDKKPDEIEEVEVDTQPIIEEVVAQVTKDFDKKLPKAEKIAESVKDKIVDTLVGEKSKEDQSPWQREGRAPRDYDEVAEWGTEKAKKELRVEIEEKEKAQKKEDKKTKKADAEKQKEWSEYWDGQVNKLTEEGKLPTVNEDIQKKLSEGKALTEEEKDDEGVKARRELFKLANDNKETNLELIYYKHIAGKKEEPAGATAPVIGSRKAVAPSGGEKEYSYEEIRDAKTMHDLLPKK